MRIVLTKVGEEEFSKENNDYKIQNYQYNNMKILNTDGNMPQIKPPFYSKSNTKKYHLYSPESRIDNKYKNKIFTENKYDKYNNKRIMNKNSLKKAGQYSINKNYNPNNYKNSLFNNMNINNYKEEAPFKLVPINNNSLISISKDFQELFSDKENKDKSPIGENDIKTFNKENKNIEDNKLIVKQKNLSLPKINMRNGVSLKNILSSKNRRNVDEFYLKKEINKTDTNLINYLGLDKFIQPSFVKKVNKADDEELFKLDKICQKYFHNEEEGNIIKNNIQFKIKNRFLKDAEYCKNGLKNMNNDLKGIEQIYKDFQSKVDNFRENRISYLKQIKEKNNNKK